MNTTRAVLQQPTFENRLIESRTLGAGNVQRRPFARIDWDQLSSETEAAAEAVIHVKTPPALAALPTLLGYEFDLRRLTTSELLGRIVVAELLKQRGAHTLICAPIPYQGRPRWDIYAVETVTLALLGRLATERDALNELVHAGLERVIWAPRMKDSRYPSSWHLLEYSRITPLEIETRWFEESALKAEEESANRRKLLIESLAADAELPVLHERLDNLHRLLASDWPRLVVLADSA